MTKTITTKAQKQEWERFFISGSILNVQETGEKVVLASSTVSAVDKDGTDVSTSFLDQTSKKLDTDPKSCNNDTDNMLSVRVQSGDEDVSPYRVTFRMVTTLGNRYEADMRVGVNEVQ